MATPTGSLGGALSTAWAADLSAIAGNTGVKCTIGATTFFAVPQIIPKDVALSVGIAGIRGTIIELHAATPDIPPLPIRAQTPITIVGLPLVAAGVALACTVKEAVLEADGSLTRIFVELPPP